MTRKQIQEGLMVQVRLFLHFERIGKSEEGKKSADKQKPRHAI